MAFTDDVKAAARTLLKKEIIIAFIVLLFTAGWLYNSWLSSLSNEVKRMADIEYRVKMFFIPQLSYEGVSAKLIVDVSPDLTSADITTKWNTPLKLVSLSDTKKVLGMKITGISSFDCPKFLDFVALARYPEIEVNGVHYPGDIGGEACPGTSDVDLFIASYR